MARREIQHTPGKRQAFFWLMLLLTIPFLFWFENRIAAIFYNKTQCEEPRKRNWRNYAIDIPPGYAVHGLDVSHYSCDIAWEDVKKMNFNGVKVEFAFMRATKGLNLIDYQFNENWANIKKSGILRGAYHFYYYKKDAAQQANFFLQNVKLERGDLPPVLDVEKDIETDDSKLDKEKILRGIETWLKIVEKESGIRPIIYTNLDYYKRYIAGDRFQAYPIWIAGYNRGNVKLPDGRAWWFWQVSESARVNGISEKVDFNVFSGNLWQLQAICKR